MTSAYAMGEKPARVLSLDVFRGFVVLGMIFVNYLDEMPNLSPLLKHAKAGQDTITVPDLVFPAFLFITGVAIPLSLHEGIARGSRRWALLLRVAPRAALLMLIGVVYEYRRDMVPEHTGLSLVHWMSLFYLGLLLALNHYPESDRPWKNRLHLGCRIAGALLVATMLAIYRGKATPDGGYEWVHHGWWGILGLIGWSYLNVSLLYLAVRGRELPLIALFGLLLALYMGGRHGVTDFLGPVNDFVNVPAVLGSISANVMAGVLVGNRLVDPAETGPSRLRFMLWLGVTLFGGGFLLRPVHGFSKIGATESYTLVTAGLATLALAAFYWAIDVRKWIRWVPLLGLVGANPLLAYLVPDLWDHLVKVLGADGLWWKWAWHFHEQGGGAGLLNAAAMTLLMLVVTVLLVRSGLRLKV